MKSSCRRGKNNRTRLLLGERERDNSHASAFLNYELNKPKTFLKLQRQRGLPLRRRTHPVDDPGFVDVLWTQRWSRGVSVSSSLAVTKALLCCCGRTTLANNGIKFSTYHQPRHSRHALLGFSGRVVKNIAINMEVWT